MSESSVIMEPMSGGGGPATPSDKGEHVFNAVNRIMEEQLASWLSGCAEGERKTAAADAINTWRANAAAFASARDNEHFHVADKGDAMNSARFSRMKSELEKAAQDLASGNPSVGTRGYTIFNARLNDITLLDTSASPLVSGQSVSSIDFVAAQRRKSQLKGREKDAFDAWMESTTGLMYATIASLRDAATAVGLARGA